MGVISVTERTGPRPYFVKGRYGITDPSRSPTWHGDDFSTIIQVDPTGEDPLEIFAQAVYETIFDEETRLNQDGSVETEITFNSITPL